MAYFRTLRCLFFCCSAAYLCSAALEFSARAQILAPLQLQEEKRVQAEQRAALKQSGSRTEATPNADIFGSAPFPVSALATTHAQHDVFSYALDGAFIRISFGQTAGKQAADKKAKSADSALYGLIDIDLKPGWKTYWRNPGASGLSPKIEIDGGAQAELLFPAPQLLQADDEWNYGYKNHVTLPFRIILPNAAAAGQKQSLYTGSLSLGICEKICMPQKIAFLFNAAAITQDTEQNALLNQALAALPKPASKNFGLISAKQIEKKPGQKALELRLAVPYGAKAAPQLFLDGGDAMQLGLPELKKTQSGACPPAARRTAQSANGKTRGKQACSSLHTYYVPLLFGEVKKETKLSYTIISAGEAVSGAVSVSKF